VRESASIGGISKFTSSLKFAINPRDGIGIAVDGKRLPVEPLGAPDSRPREIDNIDPRNETGSTQRRAFQ